MAVRADIYWREPGIAMPGDDYKRRETSPGVYQCGCRWERRSGWGDVLVECPIHKAATQASVDKFERETIRCQKA